MTLLLWFYFFVVMPVLWLVAGYRILRWALS